MAEQATLAVQLHNACFPVLGPSKESLTISVCVQLANSLTRGPHYILFEHRGVNGNTHAHKPRGCQ